MNRLQPVRRTLASILLGMLLSVLLFLAGLCVLWIGNVITGDFKVCQLPLSVGERTNEVVQRDGTHVILPFGVSLDKVLVTEQPPCMTILESANWRMAESDRPAAENATTVHIGDWRITVDSLFMNAVPVKDGFVSRRRMGAMPAAYVRVENEETHAAARGWIFTGYAAVEARNLPLGDNLVLALCKPEVDNYYADVTMFRNNGTRKQIHLTALEPHREGRFKFCLADFDREQGKWADNCMIEIEMIPSPWKIVLGFVLLVLGIRGFVRSLRFLRMRQIRRRTLMGG